MNHHQAMQIMERKLSGLKECPFCKREPKHLTVAHNEQYVLSQNQLFTGHQYFYHCTCCRNNFTTPSAEMIGNQTRKLDLSHKNGT